MQTNEQRVREFAYQIWESEGRPIGHSDRHWAMASELAASQGNSDFPTPQSEPVEPISPGEPAHPVSPTEPIQPSEPQQPGQPQAQLKNTLQDDLQDQQQAQPQAVTPPRKSRAKVAADAPKSLIDNNPISIGKPSTEASSLASDSKIETAKKPGRAKKTKATENESA